MKKIHLLFLLFVFQVNSQIVNIPDANFKEKLLLANPSNLIAKNLNGIYFKIDSNNNNEIEVAEALQVSFLDVNCISCISSNQKITNLDGLQYFSNLNEFICTMNLISSYNFSFFPNLTKLSMSYGVFTELNLSGLPNLQTLSCPGNYLTFLDLSQNPNLTSLYCAGNPLTTLLIKNSSYESDINFEFTPNLTYICCDDNEISYIQQKISQYGYTNCNLNTYCSFNPGGIYYTVQGNQKFDSNMNGCDTNDIVFPNLNLNITDGTSSGNIISNFSGNYSIFVGQGTHTITPILENPTYFNIFPTSIQVTFPDVSSSNIQNFCITPNGIHNDLEVVIVPSNPARPGFDAIYKIVYKNKGNTTMSGSVSFNFEDDKMDFVSSAPNYTMQSTNQLIYDYTNLAPFESREIIITITINSPIEIPAVNIGDQLDFTATINPITGDEFLSNNVLSLKQIVVGSFDPNDKTCIEGNVVGTNMIGEYVHYVIRFENTGTFAAENIVIKDMIDLNKFDLNTMIPFSSSHAFVTRIASDGKVEFIFEGINLPFDDANNDGYVAFKIKTKSNLAVGDTFSNNASIYFDYNFPIVTNTASTTIQALGISDFEFTTYLTLYPNPAKEVVTLLAKVDVSISSISLYNSLGQLVLVEANPNTSIDVSSLKTGNYFMKIISDKGITTTKFIKY